MSPYTDGTLNYQWYRNRNPIAGVTQPGYTVPSASNANVGGFSCAITDPALPALTLYTRTIRIALETAPTAPQNLVGVPDNQRVKLTWRKNSEADMAKYFVYAGQSLNPTTLVDSTATGNDTTLTVYGLVNGTRYYFRITAMDTLRQVSGFSNEVSIVAGDATPPAPPSGLQAYAGNFNVDLFWDSNIDPDFNYYVLYRSTSPIAIPSPADSIAAPTSPFVDLTVNNDLTYFYRLVAVDSAGNHSAASIEVSSTPSTSNPIWLRQNVPLNGGEACYNVFFANERQGWVGTSNANIYHTSNGGATWVKQSTGLDDQGFQVRDFFFLDSLNGWAPISNAGFVARTTDGGANWQLVSNGVPVTTLREIYFTDALNGCLGGGGSNFRRTTDGGLSWDAISNPPENIFRGMNFIDNLTGFGALYNTPKIYKTTDGGENWTILQDWTAQGNYFFRNMQMVNSNVGYVCGRKTTLDTGLVLKTTNGGSTWFSIGDNIFSSPIGDVWGLDFVDENNGWIATRTGYIFHTTDGGSTWTYQSSREAGSFLNSVEAVGPDGPAWVGIINPTGGVTKYGSASGQQGNQPPTVSLANPFDGQQLWGGRPFTIYWNATDDQGIVKVDLEYQVGGLFVKFATLSSNTGSYSWEVPEDLSLPSTSVRVTVYDLFGVASSDMHQNIQIVPNGSFVHNTGVTAMTVYNDGNLGSRQLSNTKPSLEFPLGNSRYNLYSGQPYIGFIAGLSDTLGPSYMYNSYFDPSQAIQVSDLGSYKKSTVTFSDNISLGVQVLQKTYAKEGDKFFIVEYTVTNNRGSNMDNLFVGQFLDLDVQPSGTSNQPAYDPINRLGYLFDPVALSVFAGVRMMDFDPSTFRRYPNTNVPSTTSANYLSFSSGIDNPVGDPVQDYRMAMARGPFFLSNGQSETVAFAICVAEGQDSLIAVSQRAQGFYDQIRSAPVAPSGLNASSVSSTQIDVNWGSTFNAAS
ncbi:MAG: hypothetical protein KDC45_05440, partial [Bacteroidetes bacterium]|nr:hypothetical protein [Bacteroidota bacterium]